MESLLFQSLRHKNFRLFWTGQLISLLGTWMQNVAQAWLVLELTHSSLKLGIVSALQFAPMLVFSLPAGTFLDYYSKRKVIIVTQGILAVQAFLLAVLDWTGTVQYWHLVVLATCLGIANAVDMPARQSIVIEMVGKEDLMNAIALNSSIFNAARAVGPALAGVLIASAGTAACFFLNGISFLAVLFALLLVRLDSPPRGAFQGFHMIADIREALGYIRRTPVILTTMILVAVVGIFGANFNVLIPVFARIELHQDAAGFGFLMSSFGGGALVGAVSLALMSRWGPKPFVLLGGGASLALFLLLMPLQKSFGLSALLFALCGWGIVTFFAMANTTVQLNTEDRFRGRVMSAYTFTFGGLMPIGSFLAGAAAHWLGAPLTFAIGGVIIGVVFLAAILRQRHLSAESPVRAGERHV